MLNGSPPGSTAATIAITTMAMRQLRRNCPAVTTPMRASASIATGTSKSSPEPSRSAVAKPKYSPARSWVSKVPSPKPSRKSSATGSTMK
jgi:hypothetical protein